MGGVARRLSIAVAALAGCALGASLVNAEGNLDGLWMDSDGEVVIELARCGDSRCGKVVWLKQPLGPDGLPLRDYRNSDPNLRSRPVCGLVVVTGFKKQPDGAWDEGTVYVSDEGASYSGRAEVLSPTRVKVTGYIGLPIFGASEVWTKVSTPVERCSARAPAASSPEWATKTTPAPIRSKPSKVEAAKSAPAR